MKIRTLACGFALGVGASLMTTAALSDDSAGSQRAAQQPSPEAMQQGIKSWMDAMTPGEQHKVLEKFVGTWETKAKIWMAGPNEPPLEARGISQVTSTLGGRFFLEQYACDFPMPDMKTGQINFTPMQGIGLTGFDKFQQMYVGCWADSMGTQLLTMRGSMNHDGTTLTMYGEMDEPMLGVRGRMVKFVTQIASDDTRVYLIYDLHAGESYKVYEVTYTRKK